MNNMLGSAIGVLVASAVAMIWGFQYRSDHQMAALGAMFGATPDPTYALAGWASGLGVLAFLVGIALLVGGLVQANRGTQKPIE
jgi:hypothetical protein